MLEEREGVITTAQKISSVNNQDIIKTYQNPDYLFQLRNRPSSIVYFFTKIIRWIIIKDYFPVYISSLNKTIILILRLKSQVMKPHLYVFINPEKHYSLLHGDFIPENIKVKEQDETLQVFDWALFTTGSHFIEIARYLISSLVPYSKVKELYLANDETGGKLSLIEEILFLYALILLYL